jgi:hypothetical protein
MSSVLMSYTSPLVRFVYLSCYPCGMFSLDFLNQQMPFTLIQFSSG